MDDSVTAPKAGFFDQDHSAEVVAGRMGPGVNPRLRQIMEVLVSHLHTAIKEADLSNEEWMQGIAFLTAVGQTCSDWRQEFILLSDILGASMLVDAISHDRPKGATENTVLGPFYLEGAPHYPNGANICIDGKGDRLLVRGRVVDTQGRPVANATVDAWQTNDEGFYDVQQRGTQPEWNLRGVFTTNEKGEYWFLTVKPRFYPIPDDGPVGQLLARLERHPYRPAHIHFIVRAQGYEAITTHIFAPDCPYLHEDPVFGVKSSLIADFRPATVEEMAACHADERPDWCVTWDFVLVPSTKPI